MPRDPFLAKKPSPGRRGGRKPVAKQWRAQDPEPRSTGNNRPFLPCSGKNSFTKEYAPDFYGKYFKTCLSFLWTDLFKSAIIQCQIIKRYGMIFPLEELVKFKGSIYEITVAASRRAYQLAMVNDPVVEENDDKVVSIAARQLFTNEVQYRIEQGPRQ